MRLAGSAVFSSFPDPSDPAKTAQSGPAGPGPQDRSTGPARAGPAGATQLRVGPSDSGCGGMLIPAGGAAASPGMAALHTQRRRRHRHRRVSLSAGNGGAGAVLGLLSGPLAGPAAAMRARGALLVRVSARVPWGRGAAASRPAGRSVPMPTARHADLSVRNRRNPDPVWTVCAARPGESECRESFFPPALPFSLTRPAPQHRPPRPGGPVRQAAAVPLLLPLRRFGHRLRLLELKRRPSRRLIAGAVRRRPSQPHFSPHTTTC